MMLDLLIKGSTVVSPESAETLDVGVQDGRVVLLASPNTVSLEAGRTIDATGKYLVPGGIDAHVHFNLGLTPAMRAQSARAGGRAAVFGGTTTFIDFALQRGEESLSSAIEAKKAELASDRPDADYALHAMLTGDISFEVLEEIRDAIAEGVVSFKMFTTFSGPSASGAMFTDDGRIWGVMGQLARHGGVAMVHCEDDCIIDFNVRRLYREGHQEAPNIALARPNLCEEAAISRVVLLARRSGSPLYIVHVSATEGVEILAEAQGRGEPVYGEALHNYLAFTHEDYRRPNGMTYHNYPALKSPRDRDALWAGLTSGVLDTVASDDFTIPLAQKLSGKEVDNAPGGHNGVETRMAYLMSEGVSKRRMSLNRLVEVSSRAPARLFGIYPRKGVVAPGSDADLVLIDPALQHTIRLQELHSDCDYSLWDGWECQGYPVTTIARGEVLVEDGRWVGSSGGGRFVPGRTPSQP
jgi:dihydropyrimidinase